MRHRDLLSGLLYLAATMCAMVMMTTGVASAALIASESFDYADGALAGNNGGSGWAGAWSSSDAFGTVSGGRYVADTAGNTDTSRKFTTALGVDGTTVWMSYIGRNDAAAPVTNGWGGVQLYDSANNPPGGTTNNGTERLFTAKPFGTTNWGMERAGNGAQNFDSGVSANGPNDSLLLYKLEFQAGAFDTVSMWVNPDVNNLGAADGVLVVDDLGTSLDEVHISHGAGGGAAAPDRRPLLKIDNLQFGDTFEDLQFVPEPGSIVLGLIGAIGLGFCRRRSG